MPYPPRATFMISRPRPHRLARPCRSPLLGSRLGDLGAIPDCAWLCFSAGCVSPIRHCHRFGKVTEGVVPHWAGRCAVASRLPLVLGPDRALRRWRPLRTTSTAGTPGFTHTPDPQALAAWPPPVFPVSVPRSGDCLLDSDDDDGGRKRQFNGLLTQVNVIEGQSGTGTTADRRSGGGPGHLDSPHDLRDPRRQHDVARAGPHVTCRHRSTPVRSRPPRRAAGELPRHPRHPGVSSAVSSCAPRQQLPRQAAEGPPRC